MITRVRLTSVALVWSLVGATASFAQQSDSTAAPRSYLKAHTGAVGGQLGISDVVAGGDYSKGASPRFSFSGSFRYVATRHWGWQVNPYYSWVAYGVNVRTPIVDPAFPNEPYKDHYLVQMAGANGQLLWLHERGSWVWHVGAGPAVYRVLLENNRKIIKDPITFDRHRATCFGATVEVGTEHFLHSLTTTSLEWTAGWHAAFAKDDARFPNGYSNNPQTFEVRFGGHYYFDLTGGGKKPAGRPAPLH